MSITSSTSADTSLHSIISTSPLYLLSHPVTFLPSSPTSSSHVNAPTLQTPKLSQSIPYLLTPLFALFLPSPLTHLLPFLPILILGSPPSVESNRKSKSSLRRNEERKKLREEVEKMLKKWERFDCVIGIGIRKIGEIETVSRGGIM
jgi:hypothetical protein